LPLTTHNMILPIVAYGDPVLNKVADEIDQEYPGLDALIKNMYETMYNAQGVGLAAPQIGRGIRLFIVDASPFAEEGQEDYELLKGFTKTFINPIIIEEDGEEWGMEEGCLSIPDVREMVYRKEKIVIEYYNENWELVEETYSGLAARVIQHEYDHIEGVLFTEYVKPLRKRLIKGRLGSIERGDIKIDYPMKFPKKR
jgi:peptide deformylase